MENRWMEFSIGTGDEMDEKNNKIAHRRIVAGRGIPRNHARIDNSPATTKGLPRKFRISSSAWSLRTHPGSPRIHGKLHPDWSREQRLEAPPREGPRFGPEKGQELLRTIPVDAIRKIHGLQPSTRDRRPLRFKGRSLTGPPLAGVAWRISGEYHHGSKLHDSCSATFQSFDGKLFVAADELNRSPCCH